MARWSREAKVAAVVFAMSAQVWPQSAGAQGAPSSAGVGDVVKLKDGSLFRGAITELVPNDHVVVLLPGGRVTALRVTPRSPTPGLCPPLRRASKKRPLFLLAVHRCLPLPPPAEPAVTVQGKKASVHFRSDDPDMQLLVEDGQSTGIAVGMRGAVDIQADTTLKGHYESRAGIRAAGIVLLVGA